jgi:chromosome partitioning protein
LARSGQLAGRDVIQPSFVPGDARRASCGRMKIVSVINYKGGVGKTTLTANLGARLASRGMRVLLVDLDPQSSLTFSFLPTEDWEARFAAGRTIRSWFEAMGGPAAPRFGQLVVQPERVHAEAAVQASGGRLGLICSDPLLIDTDLDLGARLPSEPSPQGRAGGLLAVLPTLAAALERRRAQDFLAVHRLLAAGLASLKRDSFDLVLIDCPPSFNLITRTAIVASEWLLVPARPDRLSTLGIGVLLNRVAALASAYNRSARRAEMGLRQIAPQPLGVVFTMVEEHGGKPVIVQGNAMQGVRLQGWPVFDAHVRYSATAFHQGAESGVPLVLRAFANPGWTGVVQSLDAVTEEFARRAGLAP